ncbi:MAG: Asp-tRNA(Asn)/Glu-tRNA(Gln) amidotransferase subunit GatB [Deltaproteobacteria bacterium]|nr:Asp-tRNA(Asn)/Glu-tRNA(Gln) amidotransferase subunit GatB [Deltaproteobacteria bacterium]
MQFEPIIGLEVHCQLATNSKLFCACSTVFGADANHQVCEVCLGMPGTLPVLNKTAVHYAIKLAIAVGGRINEQSTFARKQYFYPDLPKGYQITQFEQPYCEGGVVQVDKETRVELIRIHIEEDAGKNVHARDSSHIDYNRAGMPLVEIVSKPTIRSAAEAAAYLRSLRSLVRHLGISDGNLEEGSFRCDANVSLKPVGSSVLGTRCEIKNLNSFRYVERAINFEIERQRELIINGMPVIQQTLLFDAELGRTIPMRSKEESHDYRYFPDPDLPFLRISKERIKTITAALPELPLAMASRIAEQYTLPDHDAHLLTQDKVVAHYFEQVVLACENSVSSKIVANWVIGEVIPLASEQNWNMSNPVIPYESLAGLLKLIGIGTVSSKIAKVVFEEMVKSGENPALIVDKLGLVQVSDEGAIAKIVDQVIEENPEQVTQYLSGKDKVLGFFVGQIMRASKGKMNPGLVNSILLKKLDQRREHN